MSEFAKIVEELLKLPQELCKTCGKCCRIATFKGGFDYEQVLELSQKRPDSEEEAVQVDGAKDFLTIFVPYESTAKAREFAPQFVDETLAHFGKKDEDMTFFTCKYLGGDNLCMIHEDRPHLCRMYPIPHEKTLPPRRLAHGRRFPRRRAVLHHLRQERLLDGHGHRAVVEAQ